MQHNPLQANPDVCTDVLGSARLLSWYAHAAYIVLMQGMAFTSMEWQLKGRWVRQHLGKQLVYGPLAWPRCEPLARGYSVFWQQRVLSLAIYVPTTLGLLWFFCMWLVPLLPHQPCDVPCLATGSCPKMTPCGESGVKVQDCQGWVEEK